MYPIEEGIIVFQSIIKVYIFVIGGALTNTIVLQFVQKLKKIDHSRQSRHLIYEFISYGIFRNMRQKVSLFVIKFSECEKNVQLSLIDFSEVMNS